MIFLLSFAIALVVAGCDGDDGGSAPTAPVIETIAGGSIGDGRLATDAPFAPSAIGVDPSGNIYAADHLSR